MRLSPLLLLIPLAALRQKPLLDYQPRIFRYSLLRRAASRPLQTVVLILLDDDPLGACFENRLQDGFPDDLAEANGAELEERLSALLQP